jgi:hypothetical protein
MGRLNLSWRVDAWEHEDFGTEVLAGPGGSLIWKEKRSESTEQISWLDLTRRLKEIVSERACDLFLIASTPKDEAISGDLHLAGRAAEAYAALLPLYDASTGRAKSG